MKKLYYGTVMGLQGLMILSTITNIIFYILTGSSNIFLGCIYLIFIPYNRFINSGNIFEILILVLFFLITILLYVLSVREIFNINNTKAPFTILNIIWIMLSYFGVVLAMSNGVNYNPIIYMILVIMFIPLMLMKWSDQNTVMRSKVVTDIEDPLPENFQLAPKSYKQISRTAKGLPVIEIGIFLVSLYFKYLGLQNILALSLLYALTTLLAIIVFFGTIHDCKSFYKKHRTPPPTNNFLKKLSIMQIISLILFVISFLLFLI